MEPVESITNTISALPTPLPTTPPALKNIGAGVVMVDAMEDPAVRSIILR